MNKITLGLMLAFLVIFAGCGKKEEKKEAPAANEVAQKKQAQPKAPPKKVEPPSPKMDELGIIGNYLSKKSYQGQERRYTRADLEVPKDVDNALNRIGLSHYAVLRNELFARNGYKFKNPIFQNIFKKTSWYRVDSGFKFSSLSKNEGFNAEFIKRLESTFDYRKVAKWLNERDFKGKDEVYGEKVEHFLVPETVKISLNHLKVNPSRLLRNELFARRGYRFEETKLKKIFFLTNWYKSKTSDAKAIMAAMTKVELKNIELLRMMEWVDIMESVDFTLPKDVISVPTMGYNALFIREIPIKGGMLYYSSHLLWAAMAVKRQQFDDHETDIQSLVPAEVITEMESESDPLKKLSLFFEHKKYEGYTDTIKFNASDMKPPSYLKKAIRAYGVDWKILLRKEIHARKGAICSDQKSLAVFENTSWYNPRHSLVLETETRFPKNVKFTEAELINFSLLEGQELYEKYRQFKEIPFLVDLKGQTYFVKTGLIGKASGKDVKVGLLLKDLGKYEALESQEISMRDIVGKIVDEGKFDADEYWEQEQMLSASGC